MSDIAKKEKLQISLLCAGISVLVVVAGLAVYHNFIVKDDDDEEDKDDKEKSKEK